MSNETDVLEGQEAQRSVAKRATLDLFRSKQRRPREFEGDFNGEKVSFLFQAIGNVEYDKMITQCPPTTAQKAEGATYDQDVFAPRLLSKVCVDPQISEEDWKEIWTSPHWSRGEVGQLFWTAVELCNAGLNLSPTAQG